MRKILLLCLTLLAGVGLGVRFASIDKADENGDSECGAEGKPAESLTHETEKFPRARGVDSADLKPNSGRTMIAVAAVMVSIGSWIAVLVVMVSPAADPTSGETLIDLVSRLRGEIGPHAQNATSSGVETLGVLVAVSAAVLVAVMQMVRPMPAWMLDQLAVVAWCTGIVASGVAVALVVLGAPSALLTMEIVVLAIAAVTIASVVPGRVKTVREEQRKEQWLSALSQRERERKSANYRLESSGRRFMWRIATGIVSLVPWLSMAIWVVLDWPEEDQERRGWLTVLGVSGGLAIFVGQFAIACMRYTWVSSRREGEGDDVPILPVVSRSMRAWRVAGRVAFGVGLLVAVGWYCDQVHFGVKSVS